MKKSAFTIRTSVDLVDAWRERSELSGVSQQQMSEDAMLFYLGATDDPTITKRREFVLEMAKGKAKPMALWGSSVRTR